MLRFAVFTIGLFTLFACNTNSSSPESSNEHGTPAASASTASEEAQTAPPAPDSLTEIRFDRLTAHARSEALHEASLGRAMQSIGQQLIGSPYLEHTLDTPPDERLVTRLDGFDCVTFVEVALALGRGVYAQDYSFAGYADRLQEQRYRDGATPGYCERLHYFSEWIADNHDRGIVRDITADLGGERVDRSLTFMSENREAYARFANDDSLYACIQEMEASLQARSHHWHVVPEDQIDAVASQIEAGDILGFATDIGGLDIAHTGLAFRGENGQLGVLHASLSGEVLVSPDLQRYVQQIGHQIGIVVARPQVR